MKKAILSILFVLFISLPALAGQHPVLKIIDGDTIDIKYQGQKERIRMLCVDTPESVHPDQSRNTQMGKKASAYTKSRLTGQSVNLEFETKKRGKYGRLLAYVILDGENFNIELVQKGWSKYYTKYGISENHHSAFLSAEKAAKKKGLNIWSTKQPEPIVSNSSEYHGNRKSYKFHDSGCRYFNCKNCTMIFQSRSAAVKAGYIPCKICKP